MPATRFKAALTALTAAYKAAPALAAVQVYRGPNPQTATDPAFVIVGHDGALEADGTLVPDTAAGIFNQQWIQMGTRQETGTVNCVLGCQSGDPTALADLDAQATDLFGALEDAADANGGYAGGLTDMTFDATLNGRWIYRQSVAGAAVLVAYRVSYSTEW